MQRRAFLASSVTAAASIPLAAKLAGAANTLPQDTLAGTPSIKRKGNIKHSVSAVVLQHVRRRPV